MRRSLMLIAIGLLLALAITLETAPAQDSKTQKLVFASAGFDESNRFWVISRPDHLFELAILQIGNFLFIAIMKFVYTYHFEITILLMLPFVAAEIERIAHRRWSVVAAGSATSTKRSAR